MIFEYAKLAHREAENMSLSHATQLKDDQWCFMVPEKVDEVREQ